MELKVWVDGVQRVVCGVTEVTTCQDVVIALAQAIGRTGRYTLVEKWRDTERHLAPHESPVASLNTWGQYAGAPRGLREILSGGRTSDAEAKRRLHLGNGGTPHHAGGATGSASHGLWACRMEDLVRLVSIQRETLSVLEKKLAVYEAELKAWAEVRVGRAPGCSRDSVGGLIEEILRLEKHLRKTEVEMEEEEFWTTELQIELESERQLEERLEELRGRLQGCEKEIEEKLAMVQSVETGLEDMRLQRERQETEWLNEAEARAQVLRVKAELKAQERQAVQMESSCRAVDRSLGQSSKKLHDMQHELEQLTKELRQVNLQQFIKQTGTKVTVLPAEPGEDESSSGTHVIDLVPLTGSLKRPVSLQPLSSHLRVLKSPLSSGLNPEGIYV
ncbi:ras association domain-containing protein 8 isoform X2 [Phyllopteryx taeniolatus]|uniref:ras association domain-containing protein 8 isoform X2 n=1 Tax=Phyllopteryx taeniolatus TaxID=161469 RepID=UPI002AD36314|nr:ras association domain-containing protein 8 isoform X2 [Phyllopteryx taeniolatus]